MASVDKNWHTSGDSDIATMKTLRGRRAPRCDKDQFRAKMTVST